MKFNLDKLNNICIVFILVYVIFFIKIHVRPRILTYNLLKKNHKGKGTRSILW